MTRQSRLALAGAGALALALVMSGSGVAAASAPPAAVQWVTDTWRSFTAMVEPATGLPADNINGDLNPATRARYTSPTNIGSYIWSTIVARKLHVIGETEQVDRIRTTLGSLAQ